MSLIGAVITTGRPIRRLAWTGLIGFVVALTVIALLPASGARISEDSPDAKSRTHAMSALEALRSGDLLSLGKQLSTNRADTKFAYYFATDATPRDLGDVFSGVIDPRHPGALAPSVNPAAYGRALDSLAATLALATQGVDGLQVSDKWIDDFATYTTNPSLVYPDAPNSDGRRAERDRANRQNLLLLLARGRWSVRFLQYVTSTFWDWEHDRGASGDPWPGVAGDRTSPAPAPNGAYLTDGTVALMAALTANPEAAAWAFADFKPQTTGFEFDGAEHPLNSYTHYVLFEHQYGDPASPGTGTAGASTSVTALLSAARATGGAYDETAVGPQADVNVLQDFQGSIDAARADKAAWDAKSLYEKAKYKATHWRGTLTDLAHFVSSHGHAALDAISLLPLVDRPADLTNAVWYGIEGDWTNAGLSAAGIIPIYGDVFTRARVGAKVVRGLDRAGNTVDLALGMGRTAAAAIDVGDGIFAYTRGADFLTALATPRFGVTYQYGESAYEVAPSGKLIHVSGPDMGVVRRTVATESSIGGSPKLASPREDSKRVVEQGLAQYEIRIHLDTDLRQVLSHVDGIVSGRYFDGLSRKADGTYEGVEVERDDQEQPLTQAAFDALVSYDNPAYATLASGMRVEITSVSLVRIG